LGLFRAGIVEWVTIGPTVGWCWLWYEIYLSYLSYLSYPVFLTVCLSIHQLVGYYMFLPQDIVQNMILASESSGLKNHCRASSTCFKSLNTRPIWHQKVMKLLSADVANMFPWNTSDVFITWYLGVSENGVDRGRPPNGSFGWNKPSIHTHLITLRLFNIAMENGPLYLYIYT
jgi:hypothetical protein